MQDMRAYSRCMKATRNVGQMNGFHEGFIVSLSLVSIRRMLNRAQSHSLWCKGRSPNIQQSVHGLY